MKEIKIFWKFNKIIIQVFYNNFKKHGTLPKYLYMGGLVSKTDCSSLHKGYATDTDNNNICFNCYEGSTLCNNLIEHT